MSTPHGAPVRPLKKYLVEQPDSLEAYRLLQEIYWRMNDQPSYKASLQKLCLLLVKGKDCEEALRVFKECKSAGIDDVPVASWLDICRLLEDQQQPESAVEEYETLAAAYPREKQSLLAQIAAGRLGLKRLNEPALALRFYNAANASPIPHLEWDAKIQAGIEESQKALSAAPA